MGIPNLAVCPREPAAPTTSSPLSPFRSPHVTPGRSDPLPVPEYSVPLTLASEPLQQLFPLPAHSFKRGHLGARPPQPEMGQLQMVSRFLTCPCLGFLICQVGVVVVSTSHSWGEGEGLMS